VQGAGFGVLPVVAAPATLAQVFARATPVMVLRFGFWGEGLFLHYSQA